MRKIPFTFSEHVQMGNDLDGIRSTVLQYITRLSEAYPKTSRQVRRVIAIQKAIDSLRCEMDNVFYREYPGEKFRRPYYDWVHTPYFNPDTGEKHISEQQNDE